MLKKAAIKIAKRQVSLRFIYESPQDPFKAGFNQIGLTRLNAATVTPRLGGMSAIPVSIHEPDDHLIWNKN